MAPSGGFTSAQPKAGRKDTDLSDGEVTFRDIARERLKGNSALKLEVVADVRCYLNFVDEFQQVGGKI